MTSSSTVNLLDLDAQGLVAYCDSLGEKPFRAKQLQRWIHQYNAADFDGMTDLAKSLREKLKGRATISMPGIVSDHISTDGTRKWLIDVGNSNAVETVFIPEETRGTLCVSSQAGCAVNCRFCSTGKQGFSRNLTTGEIIGQLRMAEFALRASRGVDGGRASGGDGKGERVVTNVVMMGMGEPLLNYDAVVPAMRLMLDDNAYGLSRRRVTLSTSGVVPMMDRLGADLPVALAVSLHAPSDPLRDMLVPLTKISAARIDGSLPALSESRAARFHYFRILHARRRERQRSASARVAGAHTRRAMQVQPYSVQSVPRVGPRALETGTDQAVCTSVDGRGRRHHGA